MKFLVAFALLVAAAAAVPVSPSVTADKEAVVVKQSNTNIGTGDGYQFDSETSNGISHQEEGRVEDAGTENEGLEVRGQYSYYGDDGVLYTVVYTAGRDGFRPSGAHLPVPPV